MHENDEAITINRSDYENLVKRLDSLEKQVRNRSVKSGAPDEVVDKRHKLAAKFCDEVVSAGMIPVETKTSYVMGAFLLWFSQGGYPPSIIEGGTSENKYLGMHRVLVNEMKNAFGVKADGKKFVKDADEPPRDLIDMCR